jgi:hypothetical protein
MTVATERTLLNANDSGRKWPTTSLADAVLKDSEGTVTEKITGPAGSATVKLSRPAVRVLHVTSYVTATRVWSVINVPVEGTDFSVNLNDAAQGGVCSLKELLATSYAAATWVVQYQPLAAEGTIGGQSNASRTAPVS